MATEEAFLRAICDEINDTLRRLVFSDWLDERGDPRGEWVRIECELTKLGRKDERRRTLEARKRELEESHREELIGWERRFALARIQDKVSRAPISHWLYDDGSKHNGRLGRVLSEDEVVAFEREYGITLPEEYRTFLLEVGDGGLGPGGGLCPLAEAAEQSPTRDLDQPFPFCYRLCEEERARFGEDLRSHSWQEALALAERRGQGAPRNRREIEYYQPGVLYLATPNEPWASVYLVVTGEDRGLTWGYGHIECGWVPETQTWAEDEEGIDKPPRGFFRWYEDWLDVLLMED